MELVQRNDMGEGIFNALNFVKCKKERGMLKVPVNPLKVIITPQLNIIRSKKRLLFQKEIKGLMGMHLCMNEKTGLYLSGGWGIGGPALIAVCEELYALGVREFYFAGIAGRLSEEIEEGSVWAASSVIREDGTSGHYLSKNHSEELSPGIPGILNLPELLDGIQARETKFVSTDAPYRETTEKYDIWCNKGAKLVEMETASLYAFGKFYNIPVISVCVAADSLVNGKWDMVKNYNLIENKLASVIDKLLEKLND